MRKNMPDGANQNMTDGANQNMTKGEMAMSSWSVEIFCSFLCM